MDFQPIVSKILPDGSTQKIDIRPVIEICPECVLVGMAPDPRLRRPELTDTYSVTEAPCSTHQRSRR